MPTVAHALRQHAPGYLDLYGQRMPTEHKRVLALITACRTGALGFLHYRCDSCRRMQLVARSCRNRHCPNCQSDKARLWLAKRTAALLPVPYFLVTFTVPEALRKMVRANQRVCYQGERQMRTYQCRTIVPIVPEQLRHLFYTRRVNAHLPLAQALFDTGSQTIRQLASGPRFVGTDRRGFFGALQTWGRDFTVYHPHVHSVVPGGGVSADGSRWQAAPENFLLPEKAASLVFRAKFRDAMDAAGLLEAINQAAPEVWKKQWVVDVEPVGDGRAVLKYLAPYVYRVAISNNRIDAVDTSSVTYHFTPTGSQQVVTRRVSGNESPQAAAPCSTTTRWPISTPDSRANGIQLDGITVLDDNSRKVPLAESFRAAPDSAKTPKVGCPLDSSGSLNKELELRLTPIPLPTGAR